MRILLAGATGALGIPLTRRLRESGHEVIGITRTSEQARRLHALGAESVVGDVLERTALFDALAGTTADVVVSELTALKKAPARHSAMAATDRLRIEGTAHLLEAARRVGARRFVTQSMVFGYGYRDFGDDVLTEGSPFGRLQGDAFDAHLAAMASNERQAFQAQGVDGVALRYGLLYGGDIATVTRMLSRRSLPVARGGGALAFVHHEDAAAATVAAIEHGSGGSAYNIVDDVAMSFREMLDIIADTRNVRRPYAVPRWVLRTAAPYAAMMMCGINMHVSNDRAARELGWRPAYPSVREGVRATAPLKS